MILLDNTVLSNFAHIERPDLLRLALPDAHTTPQVMAELQSGVILGRLPACDWRMYPKTLICDIIADLQSEHIINARISIR